MTRVVVVGAGFAGLSAARSLLRAGVDDVVVLEARDRVGGRTKHGRIAGVDVDLGGMWQGASQTRLLGLAREHGVETYETWLDGKAVFVLDGQEHHGEGEDFEGRFGLVDKLDYLQMEVRLKRLLAEHDVERPWAHPKAAFLDGLTVDAWMARTPGTSLLRSAIRLICLSLFCAEASQVSMLFLVHYLASGDGLDVLMSAAPGGAQHRLFHGGVHQIARAVAAELGDRVLLDTPVDGIDWSASGATVRSEARSWDADAVIVAAPITLLDRITFEPPLPQRRQRLQQRLAMGSAIKYWVAYDTPFWRDQGFNGSVFRDDVPCSPCFDVTPPGSGVGLIAGFFDADHALDNADAGVEGRRDLVLDMLAQHFGAAAREPLDYVDEDWTASTWSNGCYGAYAAPGVYAGLAPTLREPIGPIHWAGTETSPHWTGYIEGAIRSGEAAAEAVTRVRGA